MDGKEFLEKITPLILNNEGCVVHGWELGDEWSSVPIESIDYNETDNVISLDT